MPASPLRLSSFSTLGHGCARALRRGLCRVHVSPVSSGSATAAAAMAKRRRIRAAGNKRWAMMCIIASTVFIFSLLMESVGGGRVE